MTAAIPQGNRRTQELALPAFTLLWREIVRFYRQRARVVGVIASPVLFWIVIGSGFGKSFTSDSGTSQHYLDYFYPGALIMIVLFTEIFTMMSVIEDRKEGFLLSALVVLLVSFALTALGFAIAWPMDSTQAFHAIINLFLIPLWLLSGALFPLSSASSWLRLLMQINPLTYGVEALRSVLYPASRGEFSLVASMATLVLFSLVMFGAAFVMVNRRSTKPAA